MKNPKLFIAMMHLLVITILVTHLLPPALGSTPYTLETEIPKGRLRYYGVKVVDKTQDGGSEYSMLLACHSCNDTSCTHETEDFEECPTGTRHCVTEIDPKYGLVTKRGCAGQTHYSGLDGSDTCSLASDENSKTSDTKLAFSRCILCGAPYCNDKNQLATLRMKPNISSAAVAKQSDDETPDFQTPHGVQFSVTDNKEEVKGEPTTNNKIDEEPTNEVKLLMPDQHRKKPMKKFEEMTANELALEWLENLKKGANYTLIEDHTVPVSKEQEQQDAQTQREKEFLEGKPTWRQQFGSDPYYVSRIGAGVPLEDIEGFNNSQGAMVANLAEIYLVTLFVCVFLG